METEEHAKKLKQFKGGGNSSLVNIRWLHRNLMICSYQVNLGEHCGAMEGGSEVLNMGNSVVVRTDVIKHPVVPTWAPVS